MSETYWAELVFGPATEAQAQAVADLDDASFDASVDAPWLDHGVRPSGGRRGSWTLTDVSASFGIDQFRSAMDWLREQGVSYVGRDDGKYELAGRIEDWKPGWPAPRVRTNTPDGPALLAADWRVVVSRFAEPADRSRFLEEVFFAEVELG